MLHTLSHMPAKMDGWFVSLTHILVAGMQGTTVLHKFKKKILRIRSKYIIVQCINIGSWCHNTMLL